MPKRIVLSDDEDDEDPTPVSAGSGKSTSAVMVKDEFITPHKSESPSERKRTTRGSSGRESTKAEKERRKAMDQMASGMGQGLAGLDVDSSEESENAFIDDGDESYSYDNDEEQDDRNTRRGSSSSGKKKAKKVAQFVIGLPVNPSRSSTKPARRDDTYVSDAESYGSEDMNEFILSKEEEEEEEEDRIRKESKARRKAKKEKQRKKEMKRAAAAADLDETIRKGGKSSAKKSPGRKRIIVLDDDEEEEEEEVQQPSKGRKRQKVVSADSSEEEENAVSSSSDDDDDEDEDEDEEEEDDALDGPELYWQVDKMASEEHELENTVSMRQHFDEGEAVQVYIEYLCHCHMKPNFADKVLKSPREPTHARYLAAAKLIEDRMCTVRESLVGSGAWSGKGKDFTWELQQRPFYTTDASNIDRLRESVEGAGADYGICAACARQNKIPPNIVYLFGAEYDARAVWNRKQWHLEMPEGVFLHEKQKEKQQQRGEEKVEENDKEEEEENDEDEEEEDDDEEEEGYSDVEDAPVACQWWLKKWPGKLTTGKETSWELSGHCRGRTQLYHALLHYKLRLLLKVRDKLERLYGNISELVSNREFCEAEAERFENLLEIATSKFGGKGMEDAAVRRVAGVWQDGHGALAPEAAANQASAQKRSAVSMLQWLSKTNKKGAAGGGSGRTGNDDDDDFEG